MNSPKIDLLLRLADHLEKEKLGHRTFWYGFYNAGTFLNSEYDPRYDKDTRLSHCGTSGCAIGECPFIFPEWYFRFDGMPECRKGLGPVESGQQFFDIDLHQFRHLFAPSHQLIDTYGGKVLEENATQFEVAHNIRIFCQFVNQ